MRFKIIFFLLALLYQSTSYSKALEASEFNQKHLSSYFSALLYYDNQKNAEALKYFEDSKALINNHDNFLREYVFSLVLNGQVKKATKQIKLSKRSKKLDFFEANLLLVLDSLDKKNFKKASLGLKKIEIFQDKTTYQFIIFKILESYTNLFKSKKLEKPNKDFGNLSLITEAFQNCYLNTSKTNSYFVNLINSGEGDYSRYLFFYLSKIIKSKDLKTAKEISNTIDPLRSSLLISQAKKWIEDKNTNQFSKYFSCNNENDLLAEFFFLISNLYSSEDKFEQSNFYLNISNYLNPKFYFNLSLLAENFFLKKNFDVAIEILKKFNKKDEVYYWYKIKKIVQIYADEGNEKKSLDYLNKKVKELKNPSNKILYDIGNIYKSFKKYNQAIEYYSLVLSELDKNSATYADILYRRGGSFERLGKYELSDKDLLQSLKIRPDDPYTLNYLAYGWLERGYKIDESLKMLNKAYKQKKNDPYIIDSVGWGYYLVGDYEKAEKYLRKAVELLPDDPIANDHYGDVLWHLNRKLQAKYFWESALNNEETDEEMKKDIKKKLLNGLKKFNS